MEKLEDKTKMCMIKIREMKSSYINPKYEYCRNVCSGYVDVLPCVLGEYKPIGNTEPLNFGINAYNLMNGEKWHTPIP